MPEDKEKAMEKKEESKPSSPPTGTGELCDAEVEKVVGGQDGAKNVISNVR